MKKSILVSLLATLLFLSTAALAATTAQPVSAYAKNTQASATNTTSSASSNSAPPVPTILPPAPDINAKGYVLLDANSGTILASKNEHEKMPPASLTKMTALYVIFSALKNGQIHLDDQVPISKKAWKTGGSKMFVRVGTHVPVQKLIQGIIVASGNDAVVALAQYIGGTVPSFVAMMNQTAQALGMTNTHYMDPTGLPNKEHYSTPYDIALIANALIHNFPEYYHFFDEKWITFSGIKQPNRNRLLWRDSWVDGLKTGHTKEAGYCLVTSGVQHGMRLISVVMGTPTDRARTDDSQALLNWGFRFYNTHELYQAGETVSQPRVWLGKEKTVPMGLSEPLYITIPNGQYKNVQVTLKMNGKLKAPIKTGNQYGEVVVSLNGKTIKTMPVVALADDPIGGFWTRLHDHIALFFH